MNASYTGQFIYAVILLEDLEPRAADPSLRVVPIPTLREFAGAFEDVEELAEEGLFPSTESSSSKILSAKKSTLSCKSDEAKRRPKKHAHATANLLHVQICSATRNGYSQMTPRPLNPILATEATV